MILKTIQIAEQRKLGYPRGDSEEVEEGAGWGTPTWGRSCQDGKEEQQVQEGVNFINILLETFLHESVFSSFSLSKVSLCNFLAQEYQRKSCS